MLKSMEDSHPVKVSSRTNFVTRPRHHKYAVGTEAKTEDPIIKEAFLL